MYSAWVERVTSCVRIYCELQYSCAFTNSRPACVCMYPKLGNTCACLLVSRAESVFVRSLPCIENYDHTCTDHVSRSESVCVCVCVCVFVAL